MPITCAKLISDKSASTRTSLLTSTWCHWTPFLRSAARAAAFPASENPAVSSTITGISCPGSAKLCPEMKAALSSSSCAAAAHVYAHVYVCKKMWHNMKAIDLFKSVYSNTQRRRHTVHTCMHMFTCIYITYDHIEYTQTHREGDISYTHVCMCLFICISLITTLSKHTVKETYRTRMLVRVYVCIHHLPQ